MTVCACSARRRSGRAVDGDFFFLFFPFPFSLCSAFSSCFPLASRLSSLPISFGLWGDYLIFAACFSIGEGRGGRESYSETTREVVVVGVPGRVGGSPSERGMASWG